VAAPGLLHIKMPNHRQQIQGNFKQQYTNVKVQQLLNVQLFTREIN
jgi:hypothetical protein